MLQWLFDADAVPPGEEVAEALMRVVAGGSSG
jgi:hypothetical protein